MGKTQSDSWRVLETVVSASKTDGTDCGNKVLAGLKQQQFLKLDLCVCTTKPYRPDARQAASCLCSSAGSAPQGKGAGVEAVGGPFCWNNLKSSGFDQLLPLCWCYFLCCFLQEEMAQRPHGDLLLARICSPIRTTGGLGFGLASWPEAVRCYCSDSGYVSLRVREWYLNAPHGVVLRWGLMSLPKWWWGVGAVHEGTCLGSDLSSPWNLPLISAPVWQESPAWLCFTLTMHLFAKLVKYLKREIINHNPVMCYVRK